jgi:hypothetical protein
MEGPTLPVAIVIRGAGYHVYRAATSAGPFTRLNTDLISATNFTDAVQATNTYMVRAVKLEVSASGSYYNASQGIFQSFIPVVLRVAPVRLCDRFVPRRLGSATTKRSGDNNEI